jgi:hypothetical protein
MPFWVKSVEKEKNDRNWYELHVAVVRDHCEKQGQESKTRFLPLWLEEYVSYFNVYYC